MINYTKGTPAEEGWYLLNVDGEHTVAELTVFSDGDLLWSVSGADYDCWTHDQRHTYDIAVVCKLDLDAIAEAAKHAGAEPPVAIHEEPSFATELEMTPRSPTPEEEAKAIEEGRYKPKNDSWSGW